MHRHTHTQTSTQPPVDESPFYIYTRLHCIIYALVTRQGLCLPYMDRNEMKPELAHAHTYLSGSRRNKATMLKHYLILIKYFEKPRN